MKVECQICHKRLVAKDVVVGGEEMIYPRKHKWYGQECRGSWMRGLKLPATEHPTSPVATRRGASRSEATKPNEDEL